jgi:hypothetical protein
MAVEVSACIFVLSIVSLDEVTSRSTLMAVIFRHGVGNNQLRASQSRSFTGEQ